MKRLKKLVIASTLALSLVGVVNQADAATTYEVKSGDSLWKISNNFGISLTKLREVNNQWSDLIYVGQQLVIPETISAYEKDLLARLINAEVKGEPYAGKVAVATVVLNRVDSSLFPNTVKDVIYERSAGGYYAFTPVQNGAINEAATAEARKAVDEALAFRGQGSGSLYFYNPKTASSSWILSREVTVTIGNHRFAK